MNEPTKFLDDLRDEVESVRRRMMDIAFRAAKLTAALGEGGVKEMWRELYLQAIGLLRLLMDGALSKMTDLLREQVAMTMDLQSDSDWYRKGRRDFAAVAVEQLNQAIDAGLADGYEALVALVRLLLEQAEREVG